MSPRYRVTLSEQERKELEALTRREDGLDAALTCRLREKPRKKVTFDGTFEASLIALACSDAPEGHRRWTVRLLAHKAVELKFALSVSHMTVQRVLKKMNLNLIMASAEKSLQKDAQHL